MLNQKEIKQLSGLVKKINRPQDGLPQGVFNALTKIVPFVACELVIMGERGLLLTWRNDEWWTGWHVPGGLLHYGEDFVERLKKVAQIELGVKLKRVKFLFPMNYKKTARGHDVSLVFLGVLAKSPQTGKFFKAMPKDIILEHKELWRRIKQL